MPDFPLRTSVTAQWTKTYKFLEVYATNKNGQVWACYFEQATKKWGDWFIVDPLTDRAPATPLTVTASPDCSTTFLFGVDRTGSVSVSTGTTYNVWYRFESLGWVAKPGTTVSAIWYHDELHIFVVGSTGSALHSIRNKDGAWNLQNAVHYDNVQLLPGSTIVPAVVYGRLCVTGVDANSTVWQSVFGQKIKGDWDNWTCFPATVVAGTEIYPTANGNGNLGHAGNGFLLKKQRAYQKVDQWYDWDRVRNLDKIHTGGKIVEINNPSRDERPDKIYVVGNDGIVWTDWWSYDYLE
ncbi:hypothetical protein VHEMI04401 [[Torrubiella] hemipterigena]|uniref:Fucose-specific lectin n=1 Tax=[Torrubiella] hemipterigena TaxID=1531966 RepID=A0A0A1T146_9HYPO|nr:hypothetical protein VHEMI04401 [[Torrubiella] hemipterigena]